MKLIKSLNHGISGDEYQKNSWHTVCSGLGIGVCKDCMANYWNFF